MSRSALVLSAVAVAAAFGLSGCGDDGPARAPAPTGAPAPAPVTEPPAGAQPPASMAPLPPPSAVTEVMVRLADPNIPGADKLDTIEMATANDAAAMDKFGQALRDGGLMPTTIEAKDLTWAEGQQGTVVAVVTIKSANPDSGDFTSPMEFRFTDDRWQLTRQSADALLHLGDVPPPAPTP